jgi:hypothetical protein
LGKKKPIDAEIDFIADAIDHIKRTLGKRGKDSKWTWSQTRRFNQAKRFESASAYWCEKMHPSLRWSHGDKESKTTGKRPDHFGKRK